MRTNRAAIGARVKVVVAGRRAASARSTGRSAAAAASGRRRSARRSASGGRRRSGGSRSSGRSPATTQVLTGLEVNRCYHVREGRVRGDEARTPELPVARRLGSIAGAGPPLILTHRETPPYPHRSRPPGGRRRWPRRRAASARRARPPRQGPPGFPPTAYAEFGSSMGEASHFGEIGWTRRAVRRIHRRHAGRLRGQALRDGRHGPQAFRRDEPPDQRDRRRDEEPLPGRLSRSRRTRRSAPRGHRRAISGSSAGPQDQFDAFAEGMRSRLQGQALPGRGLGAPAGGRDGQADQRDRGGRVAAGDGRAVRPLEARVRT